MRRNNDAYYTPEWAVDNLLKCVDVSKYANIFEPCSGDGAISNRLRVLGRNNVSTNDIDQNVKALSHYNYLLQDWSKVDWIITNPPFDNAFKFLMKAIDGTRIGVAMLLRLSFVEPTEDRGYWLSMNPPNVQIVLPRISFTGDGKKDTVTTAWFVWRHGDNTQQTVIVEAPKFKAKRLSSSATIALSASQSPL